MRDLSTPSGPKPLPSSVLPGLPGLPAAPPPAAQRIGARDAQVTPEERSPEARDPERPEDRMLGGLDVGPPHIRRALRYSFLDGLCANGMVALQETFAIAAAVSLHASSMAIAAMTSLPLLLGSVLQFLVPALVDPAKGRKHYVLWGVRLQALFLFAAAFTGFLPGPAAPWAYAAAFALAAVSASATGAYWVDWMGDLIPGSVRGRHFAWRNFWFAWMYLACALGAGAVARRFDPRHAPWLLFCGIFAAAALLRTGSYAFLRRQFEPAAAAAREAFSPLRFRPSRDFLTWCLSTSGFGAVAAMSGPFFSVWYLRDLHFGYLTIAAALSATVLGSIATLKLWGRMLDNFGTSRTLRVSGLLVCFIPVPYLFCEHPALIWLFNFYSGATWAGYNMANFNHLLAATDSRQRSHYIAFASLVGGVFGFAFTLLGGFLATRLPPLNGYALRSLFLLSAVLRTAICLAGFPRFREYREALPRRHAEVLLEIPGYRMGLGLFQNVARAFRGLRG